MSKKSRMHKIIALVMMIALVVSMLATPAIAENADMVYIGISHDGEYIATSEDGAGYMPVLLSDLEAIKLDDYGLGDFAYDGDSDGEPDVTMLHLFVYTHETLLGLDWDDVSVSGSAGSIFFQDGLFGYDLNCNYYYNGAYPEVGGWGLTADQVSLKAGDFVDYAHYSDYSFFSDENAGFNYFADTNSNISLNFEVEEEAEFNAKLVRTSFDYFGGSSAKNPVASYTVSYGDAVGNATGTTTTDANGAFKITFPSDGTWYIWADGTTVASPASATVTVTEKTGKPRVAQDVSTTLGSVLKKFTETIKEPTLGSGDWEILSLARGGYYDLGNKYFEDYYNRVVTAVDKVASGVDLQNGALAKNKSIDNSRIIIALSAIGKDARRVGSWNLIKPYESFDWIKKQGINGVIFALIALDTHNYQTTDTTIRQQCVDYLIGKELKNGGFAMSGTNPDPDITSMALQALAPYKSQKAVSDMAERAIKVLADIQLENGGYKSWGSENSESTAQVITALSAWGINPDTDSRFIKGNNSLIDTLMTYYTDNGFKHQSTGTYNQMASQQGAYALVAYDRMMNSKTSLYDMSDIPLEETDELKAILSMPEEIEGETGTTFNGIITLKGWDDEEGYKLVDYIMSVPEGVKVTGVTAGEGITGGDVNYNLEESTGKLRVAYFDANQNGDLTATSETSPMEAFKVSFELTEDAEDALNFAITGMTCKKTSDTSDDTSMDIVNISDAKATVNIVETPPTPPTDPEVSSISAVCLYEGDDIDLIPSSKKAVAIFATGLDDGYKMTYKNGETEIAMTYSPEITEKKGVTAYVAIVDSAMDIADLEVVDNYTVTSEKAADLTFGDVNDDNIINAQDALNTVNAWLRKSGDLTDMQILTMNVNGDSRVNTSDALGIVESFVNGTSARIILIAATMTND